MQPSHKQPTCRLSSMARDYGVSLYTNFCFQYFTTRTGGGNVVIADYCPFQNVSQLYNYTTRAPQVHSQLI